jgi:aminoglycoside phosphotransferase (APT) family kinase protein
MARLWDADVELNEETARQLIESQFAELAPVRLQLVGEGWDNAAYRVNDQWLFRFPRREMGASLIMTELQFLPTLSAHLPVAIPNPTFVGGPEGDYPYPFLGYEWIAGETACRREWTDEERADLAAPLGRFLKALHSIPMAAGAPADTLHRSDTAARVPMVRERLASVRLIAEEIDLSSADRLLDDCLRTTPHRGAPVWCHGDLYARHLLVNSAGRLAGVIDWGDLHAGDPAVDLGIVYSFLPASARPAFWLEYGDPGPAAMRRARFRALHYGVILPVYGRETGDCAIEKAGLAALRFALEE